MNYLILLNEFEKKVVDNYVALYTGEHFYDEYEFAGNFAIADNKEQYYEKCSPCCGIICIPIIISPDREVFFYSHLILTII